MQACLCRTLIEPTLFTFTSDLPMEAVSKARNIPSAIHWDIVHGMGFISTVFYTSQLKN